MFLTIFILAEQLAFSLLSGRGLKLVNMYLTIEIVYLRERKSIVGETIMRRRNTPD